MNKIISKDRVSEMAKYADLRITMLDYEEVYFQDMTFHDTKLLASLTAVIYGEGGSAETVAEDFWTRIFTLKDWLIVYEEKKYKLDNNYVGVCRSKKKLIVIKPNQNKTEEKNTILHEMIHAYDGLLSERLKQFLLLIFYKRLGKQIGEKKLWKIIYGDSHFESHEIDHSPLFLLKSLDLDIRFKQPLGLIFNYGRENMFKGLSKIVK